MTGEIITVSEAVKRLENKYTNSYVVRLVKQGKIQGHQSGYIWLVSWPSLQTYAGQEHPKGGSKKGVAWSKKKAGAAGKTPPAPQEMVIDTPEGAHIRIDTLRPAGQNWLHAEATQDDMRATIHLRPYGAFASVWIMDKSFDRADTYAPGRMGRKQEQRGQALLELLEQHVRSALAAAGWDTETRAGNELWRYAGSEAEQ